MSRLSRLAETVAVVRRAPTGELDAFRVPVTEEERTEVPGCLVAQASTAASGEASAPAAASEELTVYLPAGCPDLRGCSLEVRGRRYLVVGEPFRWPARGRWAVEARCRRDG